MTEHEVTPSMLLNDALIAGLSQHMHIYERWVAVSLRPGLRELLFNQADGHVDIFIRSMEDESKRRLDLRQPPNIFHHTLQTTLSRYWVFSWYEVVRTIQEKFGREDRLIALRRKLELVRVPLAKFRIANDGKLKEPVLFVRSGESSSQPEPYTAREPLEYNPVHKISVVTGSCGWQVYDTATKREVDIFRRDISDEILALWDGNKEPLS